MGSELQAWREVLDAEVVESLHELGGSEEPDLFRELVQMFCEDTPPRIEALLGARERADWAAMEEAAHAMKSSSANLGASDFSERCRQIEVHAREGSHQAAARAADGIQAEYARAEKALREV